MRELTQLALDTAKQKGASYADIRIIESQTEKLSTKNGAVAGLNKGDSFGFGIRVITNGAWGFAASNELSKKEIQRVANLAVRIAKASSTMKNGNVKLAPEGIYTDTWRTPCMIDPFKVPIEDKLNLMFQIDEILRKNKNQKIVF